MTNEQASLVAAEVAERQAEVDEQHGIGFAFGLVVGITQYK